jgi:carbonic anhydrase
MHDFQRILENNRRWAAEAKAADPDFFAGMAQGQDPTFLYIGCADSRVPAEVMTGLGPGELFVHRNIANVVLPSDLSAMSVLEYAVDVLDVKHVLVTGHYGCGGVKAAMGTHSYGLVDHWLGPIRNVVRWHQAELDAIPDARARFDRVVELNVLEQIYHLSETPVIRQAWGRGRRPMVHGLVYDMHEGLLREIATNVGSQEDVDRLGVKRLAGPPAHPAHPSLPAAEEELVEQIAERVAARLAER